MLKQESAYFTTLQCNAEYGPTMSSWLKKMIKKAWKSPKAADEVARYLSKQSVAERYLFQTSQATDVILGGVKTNALPEEVYAIINHRIAVESRADDIRQNLITVIQDNILQQYNLSLDAWGTSYHDASSSIGKVTLSDAEAPLEPAPVSPITSDAFRILSSTIKQALGENIIVAPSLQTGNTDTKFYWNLTRNIYRFSPVREGGRFNAHTVDERVGMREHLEGIRFYAQMVLNGNI
jgi:Gly-Xaa carboxypeptidase